MSGVGTTVVDGIQEISALLPLLGSEQCEEHVGSALYKGFIYVCISPISIFGSLGIVKAGFNVFLASLNIQPMRFLGAKKLIDGGFRPKGSVAPLIALDPEHPNRFLVESKLEKMLADENIDNVGNLTVSWDEGNLMWNLKLVLFTLLSAPLGLAPYLFFILKPRDLETSTDPFLLAGWGFPIIRILGSIRVLVIIRMRLLFMSVDRIAKDMNINLESKFHNLSWSSHLTSETCIWGLQDWLKIYADEETNGTNIKRCFEAARRRQFPPQSRLTKFIRPSADFTLHILLAIGLILSVIGYIGCFNLVSNASDTSAGPVVWVALEALLSVLRIVVWAFNPSWDDSKGITFNLRLASHSPLITCNKSDDDIKEDGVVPVDRSTTFLEEIVAYTGPLPSFNWNNIALYYILTAEDAPSPCPPNATLHAILYVVISDYKEQTCRALTKRPGDDHPFDIYVASLESDRRSTVVNLKFKTTNDGKRVLTTPKTHSLTADTRFMEELARHYDKIIAQLRKRKKIVGFRTTWDLRRPSETTLKREDLEEDEMSVSVVVVDGKQGSQLGETIGEKETHSKDKIEEHDSNKSDIDHQEVEEKEKSNEGHSGIEEHEGDRIEEKHEGENTEEVEDQKDQEDKGGGEDSEGGAERNVEDGEEEDEKREEGEEEGEWEDGEEEGEEEEAKEEDESQKKAEGSVHTSLVSSDPKRLSGEYPTRLVLQLTPEDVVYIRQGQVERRWRELYNRLEEWVEMFVGLYSEELLQDVPADLTFAPGESVSIIQKYEANEAEYLLIECRTQMEHLLAGIAIKWDSFVHANHVQMVKSILENTFPESETKMASNEDKWLDDDVKHYLRSRREKLRGRLLSEWQRLAQSTTRSRVEAMRARIDIHSKSCRQRISRRKYHDPESEHLLGIWNNRLQRVDEQISVSGNQLLQPGDNEHPALSTAVGDQAIDTDTYLVNPQYQKDMEERLNKGAHELQRIQEESQSTSSIDLVSDFNRMKDRCRKRAQQLFSKMKDQSDDFMTLDNSEYLTSDVHSTRAYWSKDALQERRRLMDRSHKNLVVSDASVNNVGGAANMIRALKISQEFVFIDFESSKLSSKDVTQVVKGLKSLSGVTFRSPDGGRAIQGAVLQNVRAAMRQHKDTCFYQNVYATDYYRKGRPYIVFPYPKWSSCTVIFNVQEEKDYILTLKHCMTTSAALVDIDLNDHILERTWGLSQDSKDFLVDEDIFLPAAHVKTNEPNVLTIKLADDSKAVYWLSDVFLPVRPSSSTPKKTS
ncbi:hypothetical protein JR316_0001431 [Psilocybe cubensis]|uniref:Uncharacterized protein n=1 Tax=Psilocybe cubensis TaxID=181762 RepID=A0ACB8HI25_PSICU|nr:hypothetical protein JR316_0001431 [Psilocybe cubensis]KAH9487357.1 hypothetical protein JR316_0001431 [Psilocybe cubensis]